MSGPVVGLLGATGFTGRLVARTLREAGVAHRLGGRSPDRLAQLPQPDGVETFVVDTTDPGRLRDFFHGLDVVISCVGPFATLGLPVVDAAVAAGVPYVDSTGEPDFLAEVYRRHAHAASAVVPACGFDYLPGDLAAAIACADLGTAPSEVEVVYRIRGMRPSRGTARSALGAMATLPARPRRRRVHFPAGPASAVEVPWGEQLTVPLHQPGATVVTAVCAPDLLARAAGLLGPAGRFTGPAVRAGAPVLERVVDRLPEGPSDSTRAASRFEVLATARAGDRRRSVLVTGSDVYLLTAQLLVAAARQLAGTGALAPAMALEPESFLSSVAGPLLQWRRV